MAWTSWRRPWSPLRSLGLPVAQFSIRPVGAPELDQWLELRNRAFPWPEDHERFLFSQSLRPADEPVLELGAWTVDGELAGTAECYVGEEGERYIDRAESFITVAARFRRRGLGGRLAEEVERFARAQGVRWLEAILYEHDLSGSGRFLARRGFRELERYETSIQDPSRVSLEDLEPLRRRLRESGVETSSFAQIDSAVMRRSLYRCGVAIERDMPHEESVDWREAPFTTWIRKVLEGPGRSPDSVFVARDGDQIVGLTYLIAGPNGEAEVGDTGVLSSHRRRGIGRAIKMMATRYAADHGIRRIRTDNRADNAGMLAINHELGFVPDETILIYEKTLSS